MSAGISFLRGLLLFPPFFDPFLDFLFHALFGRLVISFVRAQIILRDKMIFAVVRIFVAVAVAEFFRALE